MTQLNMSDPVIQAAEAIRAAEAAFLRVPARSVIDELSGEYQRAEAHWEKAEIAFADAVPNSPEGALLKLKALLDAHLAMSSEEETLEVRHVRSLIRYVAGQMTTPRREIVS